MRITGGDLRGRKLIVPQKNVRPTSSLVKEAIFSVLNSVLIKLEMQLVDLNCLDLFAGSGALGIEALSRGAKHVTFVDNNPDSIFAIRQNIGTLSLDVRSTVVKGESLDIIRQSREVVDLVFCDPPYDWAHYGELLSERYFQLGVFESGYDISDLVAVSDLKVLKTKKYGTTYLTVVEQI